MISWSIKAAMDSNCFDKVIVSTDDLEISQISKDSGAEIPFIRPDYLSDDHATTSQVIAHAAHWAKNRFSKVTHICCIYATAPFVAAESIQKGLLAVTPEAVNFAFAATTYPYPIQRAIKINNQNGVTMFFPENQSHRSQDLEEAWHDAAQFYWGKTESWLAQKPIFSQSSRVIKIPRYRAIDIDTEEDWIFAENMFKAASVGN
jgi:pseudaminic acid cytidylyltransferase